MKIFLFKKRFKRIFAISFFLLYIFGTITAQPNCSKQAIVESIKKNLYKFYIDEDLAKNMIDTLHTKFYRSEYDDGLNIDEFLYEITKDLRDESKDLHIMVNSNGLGSRSWSVPESDDKLTSKQRRKLVKKNQDELNKINRLIQKQSTNDAFSYGEISILNGNIGFVEIKSLNSANRVSENYKPIPITSVFRKLKDTDAIIIDLRECLGGTTNMAARLSSFFLSDRNAYFGTGERICRYDSGEGYKTTVVKKNYTTAPGINNATTKGKKIYLLISRRTFSAAELAVYKIKRFLPEALIIGEQTVGGANGYFGLEYDSCYAFIIPSEKIYDEENGNYNFEGIGITPDIKIEGDSALFVAYKLATKNSGTINESEVKYFKKRKEYTSSYILEDSVFLDFIGNYRKAIIGVNKGRLEMVYDEFLKEVLIPVSKDEFQSNTFPSVKFVRNAEGNVSEILIKVSDGHSYMERFRKQ